MDLERRDIEAEVKPPIGTIRPSKDGRVITTSRGDVEQFTTPKHTVEISSPDGGLHISVRPRPQSGKRDAQ